MVVGHHWFNCETKYMYEVGSELRVAVLKEARSVRLKCVFLSCLCYCFR